MLTSNWHIFLVDFFQCKKYHDVIDRETRTCRSSGVALVKSVKAVNRNKKMTIVDRKNTNIKIMAD